MKSLITLILVFVFFGCTKGTSSIVTADEDSTSVQSPVTQTSVDSSGGPTGTVDPIDDSDIVTDGVIEEYDEPFEEEVITYPGTYQSEICGDLYLVMNASNFTFKTDQNSYTVEAYSYESDILLQQLRFPTASRNVCWDGYVAIENNSLLFYPDSIKDTTIIENPSRVLDEQYSYELCGTFSIYNSYSSGAYWQIKKDSIDYIIKNSGNINLPNVSATTVNACAYSNSNYYYNYSTSFKRLFNASAIDFGVL